MPACDSSRNAGQCRMAGSRRFGWRRRVDHALDRKSTRLNSSHLGISYAVFCLKKKNKKLERRAVQEEKVYLAGAVEQLTSMAYRTTKRRYAGWWHTQRVRTSAQASGQVVKLG